ncbi:kinase, partial [Thraustotheca clavata]
ALLLIGIILFIRRRRAQPDTSTKININRVDNNNIRTSISTSFSFDLDVSDLRAYRLESSELHVIGKIPIASGAFGEVWRGQYGTKQVAIKRLKQKDGEMVQKFIGELVILSKMNSEYIVQFVGAYWPRPIDMECVIEYMDQGDLRNYLINHPPDNFPWDKKVESIECIVNGLLYLHTFNPPIIHRDLKSHNVLLDLKKGTKISDFGCSRFMNIDEGLTTGIGTFQWMAPEVVSSKKYSVEADIYSFGVILSEYCTHQVPYEDLRHPETGGQLTMQHTMQLVSEGNLRPSFEGVNVPEWIVQIGMKCLEFDPSKRPTALELVYMIAPPGIRS